ncbi:MAG: VWA domain-containing protein [Pyrinomonadaceae bacterium]
MPPFVKIFRDPAFILIFSLFFVVPVQLLRVAAQDKKQSKAPEEDDVVRINSSLVSLDVIVKDKKGKVITNLRPEDFTIVENGVQQKIEFFDLPLTGSKESTRESAPSNISPQPQPPTGPRIPRNIIALVLDGQSTELANLKHVREGVVKYVSSNISDQDSVALFSISGGLKLLQPFSQNKARLIEAVEKAYDASSVSKTSEAQALSENIAGLRDQIAGGPGETLESSPSAGGSASSAAQVLIAKHVLQQYIQLRSALSTQQTRPVLAALAAISEGLRPVPGKKTLILFSQGFIASETLDWQIQSTIDIANRANVSIYIIDSTGLTGGAPTSGSLIPASPLGGISAATDIELRRRAAAGESVFDITRYEGLNRQQDLLYRISEDTGGRFIKNTNDINGAMERIDEEIRSRYTLSYRSTNSNFDGTFRKVKIEVNRPETTVFTRPGYYAIPPGEIVPFSPEDKKLLENFAVMEANPTLPVAIELRSFQVGEGDYVVPLLFEIPPVAVQFERKGDRQRLQLEVLGVIRNESEDKILSRLGGNFDVALTADQYQSILSNKIFYRQDIQLAAGNYVVNLIIRDRSSGKFAAKREKLVLPLAGSDFSTTEALLSRHAEPSKNSGADLISEGNIQIRPSPSREFQTSDNLIIFFNVYNAVAAKETGKPLVRVTVTLRKDGVQAGRPVDYLLTEPITNPVPHLTFAKYIKLTGLTPGKYFAIIESRDMVQRKVVKQEVSFVIVS